MKIPLEKRLRRQAYRDVAELQDQIVEIVYYLMPHAVLHGGTAIWRCFDGNRFSEDLDFYIQMEDDFKTKLEEQMQLLRLRLTKFKHTPNTIYSNIENENTTVALEIALRPYENPTTREYEKINGTAMDIFTPSAGELLVEKLNAYTNRKLIRDIYDAYHLSKTAELTKTQKEKIKPLIEKPPNPLDEKNLPNLILGGAVPPYPQMIQIIRQRLKK